MYMIDSLSVPPNHALRAPVCGSSVSIKLSWPLPTIEIQPPSPSNVPLTIRLVQPAGTFSLGTGCFLPGEVGVLVGGGVCDEPSMLSPTWGRAVRIASVSVLPYKSCAARIVARAASEKSELGERYCVSVR